MPSEKEHIKLNAHVTTYVMSRPAFLDLREATLFNLLNVIKRIHIFTSQISHLFKFRIFLILICLLFIAI